MTITRRQLVANASAIGGGVAVGLASVPGQSLAQSETPAVDLSLDSLFSTSIANTALTGEAADRVTIRKLIDAWGHFADRRMTDAQAALMEEDGTILIYDREPDGQDPVDARRGREEVRASLGPFLARFAHTTHFNGQSAISVSGDEAFAETYCMAHHVYEENGQRMLQVLSIRYYDSFRRTGGAWLFSQRQLIIDWSETRRSQA
ncbi:nuclear transport factor 2 family protein [Roseibium sp. M-1]